MDSVWSVLVVAATERELELVRSAETFCCGIGPVEAAVQTAARLVQSRPDAVLHIGIAGARTLEPPALVLGSVAVYCDLGTDGATLPRILRVSPDSQLLTRVRAALPDAHVVPIGTSGRVGGASGCDVEAMEGFGVLRACEVAGVPAVELRAISNNVGEPDRAKWRKEEAIAALADALDRLDVV